MKKVLEMVEAIKYGIMITGIAVLGGCGILVLSGLIDVALKSAMQYLCIYMLAATIICTVETIIKIINKKKEDEEK